MYNGNKFNFIRLKQYRYALSIISGILCFLSFPPFSLHYLIWIALIPVLFSILHAEDVDEVWKTGFIFGITFYGLSLFWFYYIFGAFAVALWCFITLFFALAYFFHKKFGATYFTLWLLPVLWVGIEFFRSELLPWLKFGWMTLGYTQNLNLIILQFASLFGVYGISFLIVFINLCLVYIIKKIKEKKLIIGFLANIIIVLFIVLSVGAV